MADLTFYNLNSQSLIVTVTDPDTGLPVNDATVTFALKASDGTEIFAESCTYRAASDGIYEYAFSPTFNKPVRSDYRTFIKIVDANNNESNLKAKTYIKNR